MAILMKSGRRVCGDQCHKASGDQRSCRCLCGGKYHGSENPMKRKQGDLFAQDLQKVNK